MEAVRAPRKRKLLFDEIVRLPFSFLRQRVLNRDAERAEIFTNLAHRGFHAIPNYWSKERCQQAVAAIDRLLGTPGINLQKSPDGSDHRIFGADRLDQSVDLFSDKHLHGLMNELHGRSDLVGFTLAAKLVTTEQNLGSGGGWHRDSSLAPQYKAILYLTDVTEEHGPFEYVDGSGSLTSLFASFVRGTSKVDQHRFDRIAGASSLLTGRAGTLLLANTRGIHRGAPIKAGVRYALTNYYFQGVISPEFASQIRHDCGGTSA